MKDVRVGRVTPDSKGISTEERAEGAMHLEGESVADGTLNGAGWGVWLSIKWCWVPPLSSQTTWHDALLNSPSLFGSDGLLNN